MLYHAFDEAYAAVKKIEVNEKAVNVTCYMEYTQNETIRPTINNSSIWFFVGETLRHERYHESLSLPSQSLGYNVLTNET